jgi:predicted N-formylglutamate amidohydrolase
MNRSATNKTFFSEFTVGLPNTVKSHMLSLWQKYRKKIENFVAGIIPPNARKNEKNAPKEAPLKVIHLGIHSFTPILNGIERDADVGILYDPSRPAEVKIAQTLIQNIHERAPWLKIRKNYPYLGKSDGLTTTLRQKFGPSYAGLEIEINQKLLNF